MSISELGYECGLEDDEKSSCKKARKNNKNLASSGLIERHRQTGTLISVIPTNKFRLCLDKGMISFGL